MDFQTKISSASTSEVYQVRLWKSRGQRRASCTCKAGLYAAICRHKIEAVACAPPSVAQAIGIADEDCRAARRYVTVEDEIAALEKERADLRKQFAAMLSR